MASFCRLQSVRTVCMWRPFRCEFRRTSDGNIFGTLCMLILQLLMRLQRNAFVGCCLAGPSAKIYLCACAFALVIVRFFVGTTVNVESEDCGRHSKHGRVVSNGGTGGRRKRRRRRRTRHSYIHFLCAMSWYYILQQCGSVCCLVSPGNDAMSLDLNLTLILFVWKCVIALLLFSLEMKLRKNQYQWDCYFYCCVLLFTCCDVALVIVPLPQK